MDTIKFDDWKSFRGWLYEYATQPRARRDQLLFRGHRSTRWKLETTLDRSKKFASDFQRNKVVEALMGEFRREVIRLGGQASNLPEGEAFELLARHHGLPSPLLDWSGSPYTASFFAFDDVPANQTDPIAIWRLDRAGLPDEKSGVELIDDYELLQFNRRAMQQRGVFLRVSTVERTVEEILSESLTKIELPAKEREVALSDLDEMGINSANLYFDLDGAARTARSRIIG